MADARKYLKAAEGRTVRNEATGAPWPQAGDWAEDSIFIRRRLADGDLVVATPPAEPKPEPAEPAPAVEVAPEPETTEAKPVKPPKSDK